MPIALILDCPHPAFPVAQWVVLSHVVNPSHFYVSYVAEKREREILEKKIGLFCCADGSFFSSSDVVETGGSQ